MNGFGVCLAAAVVACALPSHAATSDPMKVIYRISGVMNSPDPAHVGYATVFHCTNSSAASELLNVLVRDHTGALVKARSFTVLTRQTFMLSTHDTFAFSENYSQLAEGKHVSGGSAFILSTTTAIVCSAMIVDAASRTPAGIALHLARANPQPGWTE